jgi:predicted transcriptional regulator of viral defense system
MRRTKARKKPRPSWERLYETASVQDGYFTRDDAAKAGYSDQALQKHLRAGRIVRTMRGIYRLVHFPFGDNEELTPLWLWSGREGVFSHETALLLHDLADVMPQQVCITLPLARARDRLQIPSGLIVTFSEVLPSDRSWIGAIPVTTPRRTLEDCAMDHVQTEFLLQAIDRVRSRGLVAEKDIPADAKAAIAPFVGSVA